MVDDVGTLQDRACITANKRCRRDYWATRWQHIRDNLGGYNEREHDNGEKLWNGNINVGANAWIRAGTGSTDGDGTDRGDGMRGDGVGVGDVGAVQDGVWRERKRRDDGDGGGEGRELDGGMVGGRS